MKNLVQELYKQNIFVTLEKDELKVNFDSEIVTEGSINKLLLYKQELIEYLRETNTTVLTEKTLDDLDTISYSQSESSYTPNNNHFALFETNVKDKINELIEIYDTADQTVSNVFEDLMKDKSFLEVEVDKKYSISEYLNFLKNEILPNVANVGSSSFIGHMTGPVPKFVRDLNTLVTALNQNQVKIETSFISTLIEKQVIAIFHHLVYQNQQEFYNTFSQKSDHALGVITNGGTLSNIMVLSYVLNSLLGPDGNFEGNKKEGLNKALSHYGYEGVALLGSKMCHYSFGKALKLLGLGSNAFVEFDYDNKSDDEIEEEITAKVKELKRKKILILGIVGIAGTTESGMIDRLKVLAKIADTFNIHYHVDAAFGGSFLLENSLRNKLDGIELADSVSMCAHKQMYLPMGLSLCLFKDPDFVAHSENNAQYQARKGSYDLGKYTIEGSKNFMSLILHAAFNIFGKEGFGNIVKYNYDNAQYFSQLIDRSEEFELIYATELNIVLYRYLPKEFRGKTYLSDKDLEEINELNFNVHQEQLKRGKSFVSYTKIKKAENTTKHLVFRTVFMNPNTTRKEIFQILKEQRNIATQLEASTLKSLSIV